ncbi:hypothetical protein [Guptibacillus hwajinpoensis]|uniref:Uncharacterized protein n=1 Tax=Guptibacillus hwajinpoensis TaxID=208199 RepID=A0A0J6D3D7_9BACL|nr:hypothetical protein [Alkalihalobacillus macyae]KMM38789.1 hypothetical protein AB986_05830 [Alkalihalobacillus macyae]
MGSILLLVTLVGGLLYLYWKGRNAKEETIDKKLIQGLIIADILAVLVLHGVITAAEAELLSDQSLSDVEDYLYNHTTITEDELGDWIHHDWNGIQVADLPFDLDSG